MNILRKLASAGAVATLAMTGIVLAASPASAAVAYNGACGSGYVVIDHMSADPTGGSSGVVYLTYNGGWDCVVTETNTPGKSAYMVAQIALAKPNTTWKTDAHTYKQYAGPVYLDAPGQCIDWGGLVGSNFEIPTKWGDHCG
jgi:hypothetical protein